MSYNASATAPVPQAWSNITKPLSSSDEETDFAAAFITPDCLTSFRANTLVALWAAR